MRVRKFRHNFRPPQLKTKLPRHIKTLVGLFLVAAVAVFIAYISLVDQKKSDAAPATLTTNSATRVNQNHAILNGDVSALDEGPLSERGFDYGLDTNYGSTKKDAKLHDFNFSLKWGSFGNGNSEFIHPKGIATDSSGNVYVADTDNNRIQKFDALDGTHFTTYGSLGSGVGISEFSMPTDIATDSSGNVYIADSGNNRIQKYSGFSIYSTEWGTPGAGDTNFGNGNLGIAVGPGNYVYVSDPANNRIKKFNNSGAYQTDLDGTDIASGDFSDITDVVVDSDGNIYVADSGNNRIQKFNSSGGFVTQWGSAGTDNGEFDNLHGLAVDAYNRIYVTDTGNHRVQQFTADGDFVTAWGWYGLGTSNNKGQFADPRGIAVGSNGSVFVVDSLSDRVQKFTPSPEAAAFQVGVGDLACNTTYHFRAYGIDATGRIDGADEQFTTDSCPPTPTAPDVTSNPATSPSQTGVTLNGTLDDAGFAALVNRGFEYGPDTGYGQTITTPAESDLTIEHRWSGAGGWLLAADSENNIYATNLVENKLQKFDNIGNPIFELNTAGSGPGEFENPQDVAIDGNDYVYVTDGNNRIQVFDKDGTFIRQWTTIIPGMPTDPGPAGIAIDSSGNIYVVEVGYKKIAKFDNDGNYLTSWGGSGTGDGQFSSPYAIAVSSDGSVYVSDLTANRIQKFSSDGDYVTKWGSTGSANGQFFDSIGLATDAAGNVFVADRSNSRIQQFNPSGQFMAKWDVLDDTDQLSSAFGLAISPAKDLYVTYSDIIQKYSITEFSGAFSEDVTGLTCGSTYHFRALATNTFGVGNGSDATFLTSACAVPPVVTTNPATSISKTGASLNGNVESFEATGVTERGFEYGLDTNYGTNITTSPIIVTDDYSNSAFPIDCATTYHYRAYAINAYGTSYGDDESFTTSDCLLQTDFQLTKTLTTPPPITNGSDVTYHLEVTNEGPNASSDFGGYIYDVLPSEFTLNNDFDTTLGNDDVSCINQGLADDAPEEYYSTHYSGHVIIFCSLHQSSGTMDVDDSFGFDIKGTANTNFLNSTTTNRSIFVTSTDTEADFEDTLFQAFDDDVDMFTLPSNNVSNHVYTSDSNEPPTVSITDPDNGDHFDFGEDIDLTAIADDSDGTVSQVEIFVDDVSVGVFDNEPYSLTASGLPAGVHTVVAVATDNDGATTTSTTISFTVDGRAPSVSTVSSSSIKTTTATVNGSVTSLGSAPLTARGFQYGKTTSYGSTSSNTTSATGSFSRNLTSLTCGTTYHYRAFATNIAGTGFGSDKSFKTDACQLPPEVVITAPDNNQVFGASTTSVNLAATAHSVTSDIEKVEFYVDDVYVGTVTKPPYSMTALGLPVGTHVLVAKTYDVLGATATADPVVFYVQAPTGTPTTPTTTDNDPDTTETPDDTPTVPSDGFTPANLDNTKKTWSEVPIGYKLFSAIPWILLIVLLVIAVWYGRRAVKAYRLRARILDSLARYEATKASVNDFLSITSHILNTPLAIMNGAVELAVSKKTLTAALAKPLLDHLTSLGESVTHVQNANQMSLAQTELPEIDQKPKITNPLKDKAVYIPAVAVLACLTLAVVVVANIDGLQQSRLLTYVEFGIYLLLIGLITIIWRYRRTLETVHPQLQAHHAMAAQLLEERRKFTADLTKDLKDHYEDLQIAGGRLKETPQNQLYQNGLIMLGSLNHSLDKVQKASLVTSVSNSFAIGPLLQQATEDFTQAATDKGVTLSYLPVAGLNVMMPPEDMKEVVDSLLDNAIKFSESGDEVKIMAKKQRGKLLVSISDEGIGIASDKQAQLMQPFARATDTEKFNYEGEGLSLYVDKVILAKVGGQLKIASKPGHGTTATIVMPAKLQQSGSLTPTVIVPGASN